ncbi:hypothetical protein A7K94_0206445 [Modestobacter sp. VKM Ac-2676]|nr:hypothetical protein A7K94_0206445 [Modestobacter sp. VKM Ac-2676]
MDVTGPRPRDARVARKREDVLMAALALLTARGTAAVTHRSVAQAAGVSLSAIRYYFTTREALLLACVDRVETVRTAAAADALATAELRSPSGAEETAGLLLTAYHGPGRDDEALTGTLGWVVDCARESEALSARMAQARAVMDRQLGELLRACGREAVPVALVGAVIDGTLVAMTAEGKSGVAEEAVRALVVLLDVCARPSDSVTGPKTVGYRSVH